MNLFFSKHILVKSVVLFFILAFIGCTPVQQVQVNEQVQIKAQNENISVQQTKPAVTNKFTQFLEVGNLGKNIIESQEFTNFLTKIPTKFQSSNLFVARVDNFALGSPYGSLNQMDLALENGIIKGIVSRGYKVVEKLDFVKPRDAKEFVGTSPSDAFYMHSIDLKDHKTILEKYNSSLILQYQVIEFDDVSRSTIVYFRMLDISSMKILASTVVKVGPNISNLNQTKIKEFDRTYNSIKNFDFTKELFSKLSKASVLDVDILNISGNYKYPPSEIKLAVENGLISGLIDNSNYSIQNSFLVEKSSGFKLKYPAVYKNIVFNTNPILYEDWSEFIKATGSTELIMYRYIKNEGIYIKVVDATKNGQIIYSNVIPFSDTDNSGIFSNHDFVKSMINTKIDYKLFKDKKVLIVDGDKHPIAAEEYIQSRDKLNEMHLSIEEGIISSFVSAGQSNNFAVTEKLKTLYLKRPWMYENKIFNLNPLYLENWQQLRNFGVDLIVLYNNLIPYENYTSQNGEYKKTALTFRIIDLASGLVIFADEISNL